MGWDEVVFMNGVVAPTFCLPDYALMYSIVGKSTSASDNFKQFAQAGKWQYKNVWNSPTYNYRPLFGVLEGNEKDGVTKLYWRGVALRYHEYYNLAIEKIGLYSDIAYLDIPDSNNCGIRFQYLARINKSGYIEDLNDPVNGIYNPIAQWFYSTSTNVTPSSYPVNQIVATTDVVLDELDGKKTMYDHLIQYDGATSWRLSNEKFKHTFFQHSSNSYTDTSLRTVGTMSKVEASVHNANVGEDKWHHGELPNSSFVDANSKLSSIGMLGTDKTSNSIYQLDEDKSYIVKKEVFDIPNMTLEKGFLLCASPVYKTVEFDATFPEVYCYNGSSYVTNANEVDIYVSYNPFSNKTDSTDYVELEGTTSNYITTSGRKAHLKWVQRKTSPIYIKCVPHFTGTSYIGYTWRVKLDLTGENGKFSITDEA